jgi:uncharacterized protein (DUF58 family)
MGSLLAGFTTRGRAFIAAGVAAGILGLGLGQHTLLSIGGLLVILPVLSVLAASRTRYRIRWVREVSPTRVPAGQTASVSIRLDNVSRLPTGLLLTEDTVPYSIGARPRFILDRIEPGGTRQLSYPIQPDHRGKFVIGPLHVRVADAFGLAKVGSTAASPCTLVVTPAVTVLPHTAIAGSWLGDGDATASTAAAAGEDDVVPRAYRDGDELRRVHWRSTARYGELMVRREEQRWRNRAVLFLDTRQNGHGGRGPASSFEYAISAAASIGVHLAHEQIDGEFVTDAGAVGAQGSFEDSLLDTLAVIRPSRSSTITDGLTQLPRDNSGLLIAIVGHLTAGEARQLAATRHTSGPAMALLLAVSSWTSDRPGSWTAGETDEAAAILTASGWRVVTVTADMPLGTAWEILNHSYQARSQPAPPAGPPVPANGPPIPAAGSPASANGSPAPVNGSPAPVNGWAAPAADPPAAARPPAAATP